MRKRVSMGCQGGESGQNELHGPLGDTLRATPGATLGQRAADPTVGAAPAMAAEPPRRMAVI